MSGDVVRHSLCHALMSIKISSELRQALIARAAKTPDVEVCGLLMGRAGEVSHLIPASNVAENPRRHFEIDPATLITAHRDARSGGAQILGCYHSHPYGRAEPSDEDRAMAQDNGWVWVIIAGGEARAWHVVNGDFTPMPEIWL